MPRRSWRRLESRAWSFGAAIAVAKNEKLNSSARRGSIGANSWSNRMSEVDRIEDELRKPVNCWLNSKQQLQFARLLVLARGYERMNGTVVAESRIPIHDRPPTIGDQIATEFKRLLALARSYEPMSDMIMAEAKAPLHDRHPTNAERQAAAQSGCLHHNDGYNVCTYCGAGLSGSPTIGDRIGPGHGTDPLVR